MLQTRSEVFKMRNYLRNKMKVRLHYCLGWQKNVDIYLANKEILKCIVAVGVNYANLNVFARSNLGNDLVDLSVTVNQTYVDLLISAKTGYEGVKFIYTANYFQNQNPLTS